MHCTATKAGRHFDVNDVRRWHLQRGFRDIGYHFLVLLDGTIQQGRPLAEAGAHCTGHNANSIGVCYVGGLEEIPNGVPDANQGTVCGGESGGNGRPIDQAERGQSSRSICRTRPADTRTPQQRQALCNLLTDLRRQFPTAVIHGHRDFAPKACPCFDATEEYKSL